MNTARTLRMILTYLWRIPLCSLGYVAGAMASGALLAALGLPLPQVPEQADERILGSLLGLASLVIAVGLAPLARRLRGSFLARWMALAALSYVCLGVTSALEGAIFTSLGGMASVPVFSILPCVLFAGVLAVLFKPAGPAEPAAVSVRRFFHGRSTGQWIWRLVAAICAFPVIYWTFGLMVAPFVMGYYKQGQFALAVPNPAVILATQFARSTLSLLGAMPVLILWSGSRRHLVLALGLAFYVLVGLFGMIQSYWLAPTLQVLHNSEMLLDSLVYALALAVLLVRNDETNADELFARYLLCMAQTPAAN